MGEKFVIIQAGSEEFKILKSRLKLWTQLDEIQEKFLRDHDPHHILEFLERSTPKAQAFWEAVSWIEAITAFLSISSLNTVHLDLPLLTIKEQIKDQFSVPWDYPGRGWYIWLNIFAKEYGWRADYIAEMEVDDAFALLQEIEVDRQLEREWDWQTTELAYPYNKDTKKSEFKPLSRPVWMRPKVGPPKAKRIPKALMPIGNVIDLMKQYAESRPSV